MEEQNEKYEARDRIINAAVKLFSEKGFDGTRVSQISEAAKVNKALIYYYFKNKEAILDHLLETLFNELTGFSMGFIREHIVKMIATGSLDIEKDRFHFSDRQALEFFLQNIHRYYERIIDYVIERRHIFRVLMLESLKQNKHHYNLFRFMDLMDDSESNPIFKDIKKADSDFQLTNEMILFKFFFGLIPILSFATYFDDWKANKSVSEQDLRDSFIRGFDLLMQPFISGTDIMLTFKPPLNAS